MSNSGKNIVKKQYFYNISQNKNKNNFIRVILTKIFESKTNWIESQNNENNKVLDFSDNNAKSLIKNNITVFTFINVKYGLACFLNAYKKNFVNMYPNTFTQNASANNIDINLKNDKIYLVKEPGANGQNIYPILKKDQIKLNNKNLVIQELLEDLDLYQNKKYDIRTYFVIVKQNNKFYFLNSKEHICRITPEKYEKGNINLSNLLTNVNFHNKKDYYNVNKQIDILSNFDINNIRSKKIACLLRDFSVNLIKTTHKNNSFISKLKSSKQYECIFLGTDIIFDNSLNPYLIELNYGPAISAFFLNDNIKEKFSKIFVDYVDHIIEPLLENQDICSNSSWNMLYSCILKEELINCPRCNKNCTKMSCIDENINTE